MPSNRIGLFQRKFGATGATSTGWAIERTVNNANSAVFTITSNITTEPTVNYTINGLESGMINESLSGTITLDANGDATLPITLVPSANVGIDSSFNLELTNPITHVSIVTSSNIDIQSVPNISLVGGSTSTINSNIVHKFYTVGTNTLQINNLTQDPYLDSEPANIRIVACGGGQDGKDATFNSTYYFWAGGGGAGGQVVQTSISSSALTLGNVNVTVGDGGNPWGGNTTIIGQGFNVLATGGDMFVDSDPNNKLLSGGGNAYRKDFDDNIQNPGTGSIHTGGDAASVDGTFGSKFGGGGAGMTEDGDDADISGPFPNPCFAGDGGNGIFITELGVLGSGGGGGWFDQSGRQANPGAGGTNAGTGASVKRSSYNGTGVIVNATNGTDGYGAGGGGSARFYYDNLSVIEEHVGTKGTGGSGVAMITYPESQTTPTYRVFLPIG